MLHRAKEQGHMVLWQVRPRTPPWRPFSGGCWWMVCHPRLWSWCVKLASCIWEILASCKRRTSTEASLAGCTMSAPTANVDAPNGQGVGFTHRAKVGGFTYALSSSRAVARRTLALWRWLSSFDSFLPQFCHNCLRTATLGGGPPSLQTVFGKSRIWTFMPHSKQG